MKTMETITTLSRSDINWATTTTPKDGKSIKDVLTAEEYVEHLKRLTEKQGRVFNAN